MLGDSRQEFPMVLMTPWSYHPHGSHILWSAMTGGSVAQLLNMLEKFLSHWVESADGLDRLLLQLVTFLRDLNTKKDNVIALSSCEITVNIR